MHTQVMWDMLQLVPTGSITFHAGRCASHRSHRSGSCGEDVNIEPELNKNAFGERRIFQVQVQFSDDDILLK